MVFMFNSKLSNYQRVIPLHPSSSIESPSSNPEILAKNPKFTHYSDPMKPIKSHKSPIICPWNPWFFEEIQGSTPKAQPPLQPSDRRSMGNHRSLRGLRNQLQMQLQSSLGQGAQGTMVSGTCYLRQGEDVDNAIHILIYNG